jgi:hypothetical protein
LNHYVRDYLPILLIFKLKVLPASSYDWIISKKKKRTLPCVVDVVTVSTVLWDTINNIEIRYWAIKLRIILVIII